MMSSFNRLIQRLRGGSDFEPYVPNVTVHTLEQEQRAIRNGCNPVRSPDFTQSSSQREQRPLKANSQAWVCARMLLLGHEFTVQDVVKVLAAKKIVSNEPGRRIREAIAWLKNEGIRVSFYLEGPNPKHKRWYIAPAEANKPEYLEVMRKIGLAERAT